MEAVAGVLGEPGRREEMSVGEEQALPRGAGRLEHHRGDDVQGEHDGERDPGGRREEDGAHEHAIEDGKNCSTDHREEPGKILKISEFVGGTLCLDLVTWLAEQRSNAPRCSR